MSEKMTLVTVENTGHVLAVATRTSDEVTQLKTLDLVGDGLFIRDPISGEQRISVQAEELKIETVDLIGDTLVDFRKYQLVDDTPEPQSETVNSITLNPEEIQIDLPSIPAEDFNIWVQVEGGPNDNRHVIKETVLNSSSPSSPIILTLPTLAAGDYGVLVLVAGFKSFYIEDSIP